VNPKMFSGRAAFSALLFGAWLLSSHAALGGTQETPPAERSSLDLHEGWALQSSCVSDASGEQISSPGFRVRGWYTVSVPATVLAGLVSSGLYPDPYTGMNLRSIPGTTYPIGANFSKLPMPASSPFHCSWWYRKQFELPAGYSGKSVWLNFAGINYRANIWLNGKKIADAKDVAGAYRTYEFEVTSLLGIGSGNGGTNVLAVETFAPTEHELGINWVDWNPAPPDKDMGLWGPVYLRASGPVALRNLEVSTHFPRGSLELADLTVRANLKNATNGPTTAVVEGAIENIRFKKSFELRAGETRAVEFLPQEFSQLHVANPKLWWPALLGAQNLHTLTMSVVVKGAPSDAQSVRFGIREITSELDAKGHRLFKVNGHRILIRGGGWAPDMMLRASHERLVNEFHYVQDMHLNAIRLEGKLETDDFFNLADEQGILVMAGWCCCDHWEKWDEWRPEDLEVATKSLRSQVFRLRRHPSLLVWLNGSDVPPPANVERAYVKVLNENGWPNPYLSSASETPTRVTGASGVKMTGPYDYVSPSYWSMDPGNPKNFGGAAGFNTETSPGPAIPLVPSLRKMLGPDHLWPMDEVWSFHSGSGEFQSLNNFDDAMDAMYGKPAGLEEYVTKAQVMAYDGERALFEAYGGHKYESTGVIQWMLNNAWPSLIWHLYDYYLQPAGGYFGAKKANEPVHIQYSWGDSSVVVVNSLPHALPGLAVSAEVYDFSLRHKFSRTVRMNLPADAASRAFKVPAPTTARGAGGLTFVKLTLRDATGKVVSTNFYWLSARKTIYDWSKTTYRFTPITSYEDLQQLNELPKVDLEATAKAEKTADGQRVHVMLRNRSGHLAFQVRLGIHRKNEDMEILPVLWSDNYVELFPGEARELSAQFLSDHILDGDVELHLDGWNVTPSVVRFSGTSSEPHAGKMSHPRYPVKASGSE
jgi:exo-1,4-beta-D-glucosaminidase